MKDMFEEDRKKVIYLPAERVFTVIKNNNVEVIVANKDFTKFRTLEQLLAMNGETKVNTIKEDRGMFGRFDLVYKLASGEKLESAEQDRMDRAGNVQPFTSIGDLREYEAACKKSHAKLMEREAKIRKMKENENNEKYLEF